MKPEELAKFMHDQYEYWAKIYAWNTQEKCKVEFEDLPVENRNVMLKVAEDVIRKFENVTLDCKDCTGYGNDPYSCKDCDNMSDFKLKER